MLTYAVTPDTYLGIEAISPVFLKVAPSFCVFPTAATKDGTQLLYGTQFWYDTQLFEGTQLFYDILSYCLVLSLILSYCMILSYSFYEYKRTKTDKGWGRPLRVRRRAGVCVSDWGGVRSSFRVAGGLYCTRCRCHFRRHARLHEIYRNKK